MNFAKTGGGGLVSVEHAPYAVSRRGLEFFKILQHLGLAVLIVSHSGSLLASIELATGGSKLHHQIEFIE